MFERKMLPLITNSINVPGNQDHNPVTSEELPENVGTQNRHDHLNLPEQEHTIYGFRRSMSISKVYGAVSPRPGSGKSGIQVSDLMHI